MIESIRKCDLSTCRQMIPEGAKFYAFKATLHRFNGLPRRDAGIDFIDLCSQACLMASLSELIKMVDAEPVPGNDCHSISIGREPTAKKMVTAEPLQEECHSSPTG